MANSAYTDKGPQDVLIAKVCLSISLPQIFCYMNCLAIGKTIINCMK